MAKKKIKLHLGCGTVYLKGYTNVDAPAHRYRGKHLELMKKDNATTLDKYYKYPFVWAHSSKRHIIADRYLDIIKLKEHFKANSVSEILAYQVVEHFPKHEVVTLLKSWFALLEKGGIFRVDVPDIIETLKMINGVDCDNIEHIHDKYLDYILRLIYGSGKNKYFVHYDGYYPKKLKKMLKDIGYRRIMQHKKNIHDYPSFGFTCIK